MYTAAPSSKHGQYTSHICDRRSPPAHTQHTTTNNNDIDEIDDHNNEEQQEQYHNHHNHHQQLRYHHRQLDNVSKCFFLFSCFLIILNHFLRFCC